MLLGGLYVHPKESSFPPEACNYKFVTIFFYRFTPKIPKPFFVHILKISLSTHKTSSSPATAGHFSR